MKNYIAKEQKQMKIFAIYTWKNKLLICYDSIMSSIKQKKFETIELMFKIKI